MSRTAFDVPGNALSCSQLNFVEGGPLAVDAMPAVEGPEWVASKRLEAGKSSPCGSPRYICLQILTESGSKGVGVRPFVVSRHMR